MGLDEMPDLVTSDFSDNEQPKKQKLSKKNVTNIDEIRRELETKYACYHDLQIQTDSPRILCSLQIKLPLNAEPILLESLIDDVTKNQAFIRKISNVNAVHIEYDKNGNANNENASNWKLIVDGFNANAVFKIVDKFVDMASFETNSIFAIFEQFGIEAARNSIINELERIHSTNDKKIDGRVNIAFLEN